MATDIEGLIERLRRSAELHHVDVYRKVLIDATAALADLRSERDSARQYVIHRTKQIDAMYREQGYLTDVVRRLVGHAKNGDRPSPLLIQDAERALDYERSEDDDHGEDRDDARYEAMRGNERMEETQ